MEKTTQKFASQNFLHTDNELAAEEMQQFHPRKKSDKDIYKDPYHEINSKTFDQSFLCLIQHFKDGKVLDRHKTQ